MRKEEVIEKEMGGKVLPVALPLVQTRLVFLGLAVLALAVPFSLGHSQLVTGSIVNAALFLSAVLLPGMLFLPIIVLPSLGVWGRGLIFGPLTPLLVYFAPFIWLGNLSLILVFKRVFPSLGYFLSAFLASLVKMSLLFLAANFFFRLKLVPGLFLTAMGINQLITAWLGGFLASLLLKGAGHGKI